jgi:hypothetical protein
VHQNRGHHAKHGNHIDENHYVHHDVTHG